MSSILSNLPTLLLNDDEMLGWHKNDSKAGLFTLLVAKTLSFQLRLKHCSVPQDSDPHMLKILKFGAC